jgi:ABC-type glycerol-3-phosphate transport system permease component
LFFSILGPSKPISSPCISVSSVYIRYLYAALERKVTWPGNHSSCLTTVSHVHAWFWNMLAAYAFARIRRRRCWTTESLRRQGSC